MLFLVGEVSILFNELPHLLLCRWLREEIWFMVSYFMLILVVSCLKYLHPYTTGHPTSSSLTCFELLVLPDPLKRINIFEEIASRKYIAAIEIEPLVENAD